MYVDQRIMPLACATSRKSCEPSKTNFFTCKITRQAPQSMNQCNKKRATLTQHRHSIILYHQQQQRRQQNKKTSHWQRRPLGQSLPTPAIEPQRLCGVAKMSRYQYRLCKALLEQLCTICLDMYGKAKVAAPHRIARATRVSAKYITSYVWGIAVTRTRSQGLLLTNKLQLGGRGKLPNSK